MKLIQDLEKTYLLSHHLAIRLMALVVLLLFCPGASLGDAQQTAPHSEQPREIGLTAEEKEWRDRQGPIRVSNEFDWPPFDFVVAGEPAGFGIDLMNLLADRSGLQFEYINGYTWDELVEMFFAGRLDLLHSLSITPEREEKAFFSPPYYHSKNVLILRRDTAETNDLETLVGKTIALPQGWSSIEFFQTHYPGVKIIEVESSRQALEYVDQGRVFASVEQEGIAAYFIKKFGFHDLRLSQWIDNEELQRTSSMHFAVLKEHPMLYQVLSKALASIQPEDMVQLENKWFSWEGRQIGGDDVGLTPSERQFLVEQRSFRYCIVPGNLPFQDVAGEQVTGMAADFLEMFAERLGVRFTPVATNGWADALDKAQSRQCDLLPMVNASRERLEILDFTTAYLDYGVAIVTPQDSGFIGGLHELGELLVAVPEGSLDLDSIRGKYPRLRLQTMTNARECLLQLSAGRVEAALLSLPVATYHIKQMGLSDLKIGGYSGQQDTIRIAIPKESGPLHSIMSKLVRSLPQKDIDLVAEKWVTLTFEHHFDYRLLWQILGAVAVVLLLIVLWNRQLVRLNKKLAVAHEELARKSQELEQISVTDSLTGLFNRRYMEERLDKEVRRHLRYQRNLAIVLIDLDHFKKVNDSYGHQAGDLVLQQFASILTSSIRSSDIAGRWGGEEFIVISPENDLQGAAMLAENLRAIYARHDFGKIGRQTASFGVAAYRSIEGWEELVRRADHVLYQAKAGGRDRVEVAGS